MNQEAAIATRGLTKRYGAVRAVEALDLNVRRGEVYAFLGRNGAGKTTTIRMLLGLIRPSGGEVTVLGRRIVPGQIEVFARVGYLVETATAYPNLTVRENLDLQRRLTGAPSSGVAAAIERLALGPFADRRAGHLSLGNKQRLALARTLVHDPDLLVLDEPANGLDPAGIVELRALLRSLARERGATVFMSSHLLGEVTLLADRIGVVHEGRLTEELDRTELDSMARAYVEVGVSDPARAAAVLRQSGLEDVEADGDSGLRVFDGAARPADIARVLVGAGVELTHLAARREDLEQHFLRITRERREC